MSSTRCCNKDLKSKIFSGSTCWCGQRYAVTANALLPFVFLLAFALQLAFGFTNAALAEEVTLDKAVESWVDAEAGSSAEKILRDIEKNVQLDPKLKSNLKDSIKGFLKSKLKESFIPKPPSQAMQSIIDSIQESVKNKGRGACQKAAANIAWATAQNVNRVVIGALNSFIDIFEAVIPGGAASSMLKKLEGQIAKEVGKEVLKQLRKALENALDEYLKDYKVETYSTSYSSGGCSAVFHIIWNKAGGTFRYLIAGDCGCSEVYYRGGSKIQLSRWSVSGTGTAGWIGEAAEKANAKKAAPGSTLKGRAVTKAPVIKAVCCKDKVPAIGDPWTFVEEKPKVCVKVEIDPFDPRYKAAGKYLENNHPDTYSARVKELKAAFDKAKCADKQKALEDMHAFLQAMSDFSRKFSKYPKIRAKIDKANEEMKKAIDEANKHMEECGVKHCMLLDPPASIPDGTYTVSRDPIYFETVVSEREVCVGTTYTFSMTEGYTETESGTYYEPILVTVPQPEEPEEPEEPVTPTPEPGEPVIIEEPEEETPGGSTPPEQPETPQTPETPETPEKPEEPTQPEETETPPEEPEQPEEEIDLGLVKAQEVVVELALSGDTTDNALEGAVVKLFSEAPALPSTVAEGEEPIESDMERAMREALNFEGDVISGIVDDSGAVALSGSPLESLFVEEESDEEVEQLLENEVLVLAEETEAESEGTAAETDENNNQAAVQSGDQDATDQPAIRMQLGQAKPKKTMAVVAVKPDIVNPELQLDAMLAEAGAGDAEIVNQFQIGGTPVYVIGFVPRTYSTARTVLANSGYTLFVEEDPCRNKEADPDPHYEGAGLWEQAFDNQWAIKQVGFDQTDQSAWKDLDAENLAPVTVAVIDTGIDWFHPDLPKSVLWKNNGEVPGNGIDDDDNGYVDDIIGWDFIRQTNKPWDRDGHGTFVSGVIGAAKENGIGISGINPAARIMALKALDAFGQGHASMIAEAITYAAENGAKVINLSLGGQGITAIEQLAITHAQKLGALVVVAAGNSGAAVADYGPAGIDGVITVAATDRQDRRAGFSNWGPAIDISAPGVDVLSLRARRTDLLADIPGVKYEKGAGIVGEDRAYFRASGTSFAAPIVSAAASLIFAQNPELTADQVKRMLLNAAKDIGTTGIDNYTGYGLLDAAAALKADPDFYVESRITGVKVVRKAGKPVLRILGVADADKFAKASLLIGKGAEPEKWLRVKAPIKQTQKPAPLMDLPAQVFKGAKQWTIRLVTEGADGKKREARFNLKLG